MSQQTMDFPKPKTQKEAVILTLNTHGSITSFEAFTDWGITRLAEYIRVLRKEGVEIITEEQKVKNRFGHETIYAKYVLKKNDENILQVENNPLTLSTQANT